ncbi:copper resistance protein NlpE [Achromobacter xylosoxidans]
MMIKTTLTCALTLAFLTACAPSRNAAPVDSHTARDSLDWAGSYEGVLPCADCPGIRTRVTLSDNGSYEKQTQYLDRQPQPEVVAGTFSWESDGSTIRLTPPATASATSSAKTS